MRKYLILLVYNLCLILLLFYTFFLSGKEIRMQYLADVKGKSVEEGISLLKNYEIAIDYVESDTKKDKILYTSPRANELVYDNQLVTIYVAKESKIRFKNLEKQFISDCKNYLDEIKKNYNLIVSITYLENNDFPDGLIYKQKTIDEIIDQNDVLELVVISNKKTVKVPDFIGWHSKDVLKFLNDNKLNGEFIYIEILFPNDCVVGQSVMSGVEIYKNSTIVIYLAKES